MALTGKFTDIPSGNLNPTLSAGRLSAAFDMKALFTTDSGTCAKGEYRQHVKGQFKANGTVIQHRLCDSTWLDAGTFYEDGCGPSGTNPGPCTAYGHRDCPDHPYDMYSPDPRSTGCTYVGWDAPGITGNPGDKLEVDLSFMAELINVDTGAVLASASWTVKGSATVPTKTLRPSTLTQLAAAQRLDAVVEYHEEKGHWQVTLLIARPSRPQAQALSKRTLTVNLLDSKRQPLALLSGQQAKSYVVGGSKGETETILYFFEAGDLAPSALKVEMDGQCINLELEED
ncbi:MAG: hypothetical protein HXY26_07725 [Hydrogenophilaceae bacterium]|nr:hypothetical protein [Hydrogenophilaceae bacterium]